MREGLHRGPDTPVVRPRLRLQVTCIPLDVVAQLSELASIFVFATQDAVLALLGLVVLHNSLLLFLLLIIRSSTPRCTRRLDNSCYISSMVVRRLR